VILVGMLDSPYVRRVAIAAQFLGIPYKHRPLSVFNDYDEFRGINPLVKAPTIVCDDGTLLVDSSLIIEYLTHESAGNVSLMPADEEGYREALQLTGVALVATEKIVQITYETLRRPAETLHEPWLKRLLQQLHGALKQLDAAVDIDDGWLFGSEISHADIMIAITWRVSQFIVAGHVDAADYQNLVRFSARAEQLPEFNACPLSADA